MKHFAIVLILAMAAGAWGSQVANIDFANSKDRISGDSLTFARSGIAVDRDGTEAADGVMRTDTVTVVSPVETADLHSSINVIACDADYFYFSSGTSISRSRTATGAQQAIYTFPAVISNAYVNAKGTLFVSVEKVTGQNAGTVWRYNGSTFTKVIDHDTLTADAKVMNWSWTEAGGIMVIGEYRSSFTASNARCVYASYNDGLTWRKIHNPDNVTGRHEHTLVACLVNGVLTTYVWYGDSSNYGCTKLVDTGAATWTASEVSMPYFASQPTSGCWIPEGNKIIWGTDGSGKATGIFILDLADDSMTFVHRVEVDTTTSTDGNLLHNFFSIMKIGDLYYAAGCKDSGATIGYSGIWASRDGENWTWITDRNHNEFRIVGLGPDGNIYGKEAGGLSFFFEPAQCYNLAGALIERAGDQKQTGSLTVTRSISSFADAGGGQVTVSSSLHTLSVGEEVIIAGTNGDYDGLGGSTGKYNGTWTVLSDGFTSSAFRIEAVFCGTSTGAVVNSGIAVDTAYTDQKWHGSDSTRYTGSDIKTETKYLYLQRGDMPDLAIGDMVHVSFWIRGLVGDGTGSDKGYASACKFKLYTLAYSADNQAGTQDAATMVLFPSTDWQKVALSIPITKQHTAGQSKVFARIIPVGASGSPITWDIQVDGVVYETAVCPAEWHDAATDRNADVLSYEPVDGESASLFPATFTDTFTVASRFGSYEMGARATGDGIGYIYLRSYAVDADNFVAVVYDVSDKKFKLVDETAGTNTVVATASTAVYLTRFQPITIAVTRTGTTASLHVWAGGVYQTASGTITDHALVKSYWGCHPAGTQGGSLIFARSVMHDEVLSDVKAAMQWPSTVNMMPKVTTISSGGRFTGRF